MRRSWFRELLRRRIAVILLLILQALFIVYVVRSDTLAAEVLRDLLRLLSVVIVLHVISHKDKGANKVAWVFLALLFPLFGGAFYFLYHFQSSTRRFTQAISEITQASAGLYALPEDAFSQVEQSFLLLILLMNTGKILRLICRNPLPLVLRQAASGNEL